MKKFANYTVQFLLLFALALFVAGCSAEQNVVSNNNVADNTPAEDSTPALPESDTGLLGPKYHGQVLAGNKTPYIDFNNEDYEEATDDGKIILLYFYAPWSASSEADQYIIYKAFNDMVSPKIIGFRVDYQDDDTDATEARLASEFKVDATQTKVVLKDGKVLQKSTTKWYENDYVRQLAQYLE
jgi:hypothetical protein